MQRRCHARHSFASALRRAAGDRAGHAVEPTCRQRDMAAEPCLPLGKRARDAAPSATTQPRGLQRVGRGGLPLGGAPWRRRSGLAGTAGHRRSRPAPACRSREVIKLPRWARTRAVVLHECAHGLADDKHGPRFVARYVELLDRFLGLEPTALYASLARHRVRIAIGDALRPGRPALPAKFGNK